MKHLGIPPMIMKRPGCNYVSSYSATTMEATYLFPVDIGDYHCYEHLGIPPMIMKRAITLLSEARERNGKKNSKLNLE